MDKERSGIEVSEQTTKSKLTRRELLEIWKRERDKKNSTGARKNVIIMSKKKAVQSEIQIDTSKRKNSNITITKRGTKEGARVHTVTPQPRKRTRVSIKTVPRKTTATSSNRKTATVSSGKSVDSVQSKRILKKKKIEESGQIGLLKKRREGLLEATRTPPNRVFREVKLSFERENSLEKEIVATEELTDSTNKDSILSTPSSVAIHTDLTEGVNAVIPDIPEPPVTLTPIATIKHRTLSGADRSEESDEPIKDLKQDSEGECGMKRRRIGLRGSEIAPDDYARGESSFVVMRKINVTPRMSERLGTKVGVTPVRRSARTNKEMNSDDVATVGAYIPNKYITKDLQEPTPPCRGVEADIEKPQLSIKRLRGMAIESPYLRRHQPERVSRYEKEEFSGDLQEDMSEEIVPSFLSAEADSLHDVSNGNEENINRIVNTPLEEKAGGKGMYDNGYNTRSKAAATAATLATPRSLEHFRTYLFPTRS